MKSSESKTVTAFKPQRLDTNFFAKKSGRDFFGSKQRNHHLSFFKIDQRSHLTSSVQAKLTVGEPNDKYEKEADNVAEKVVQRLRNNDTIQKEPLKAVTSPEVIQTKCSSCEDEEILQGKRTQPDKKAKPQVQEKPGKENKAEPVSTGNKDLLKPSSNIEPPPVKKIQPVITLKVNQPPQLKGKEEDLKEEELQEARTEIRRKKSFDTATDPPVNPGNNGERRLYGNNARVIGYLQKKPIFESEAETVQRKCAKCEAEEKTQLKPADCPSLQEKRSLVQRRCRECDEGDKIFLKSATLIQRSVTDDNAAPADGSRESVVSWAKTKIGKIEAKNDAGGGRRVGAEHLLEIFRLAAPGVWDDHTVEFLSGKLPSWCGIFTVWCHKKAGKDVGNWQMGKGVSAFGTLSPTTSPQAGDIGYIDQPFQHHCIVEKVEGDTIYSIDGNSGNYSEVKQNKKPRSEYSGFFTAFGSSSVQRKEEPGEAVQPKQETSSPPSSGIESKLASTKGKGTPLAENVRSGMESAFGSDFSGVRIHTDSSAIQMSKELNAQAFTHGSDIYFNSGKYNGESSSGQQLLAHELTHTIQQGNSVHKKSVPEIQKEDGKQDLESVAKTIYDALDGWTSSKDSEIILSAFKGRNKIDTDTIVSKVAGKANNSVMYVYEWMESDMVTGHWKDLMSHFISVQAYLSERAVANIIEDLLSGYTSEDDSIKIYGIFNGSSPIKGEYMGKVLTQLEGKSGLGKEATAEWLFGDMTDVQSHKLIIYFFNSESTYAADYAAYWQAKKIENLLAGYTGVEDSQSIVTNFEKVPKELQSKVLFELEKLTKARWDQTAAQALMEDMQMEDYEKLRGLMPVLPIYDIKKNFLEWAWDKVTLGFDYVEALLEYLVCGLVGVILGVLSIVTDIIVAVKDLVLAPIDFMGFILYQITGRWGKESSDKVVQFFKGMGEFFGAPGEAISQMWNDLVLEAKLIEGPFKECQQAIFWVRRVTNLLVNIILIIWAGYGAVKLALEAIESIVALARAGRLLASLRSLPGKIASSIRNLAPSAARATANGIRKIVELVTNPAKILASTRNTLTAIRLAAQDEGYFSFLRKQAGKTIKNEKEFWQKRKEFWSKRSETINAGVEGTEAKLADGVDAATTNPGKSEAIIKEGEKQATATQNHSQDIMDEIKGEKPPVSDDAATAKALEREKTLQQSALKEGDKLTPVEMQAEAGWARENMAKVRPSTEPGYVSEIELPNGHIWRKTPEGVWCRFSLKPTLCALDFEGAKELKPTRKVSRTEVSHDIGVQAGREFAENTLNLEDAGLVNPFEFRGKYGQGFDDIMRVKGTDEFVILEYKGGTADLSPGQMERAWVVSRIQRMRKEGGDLGNFIAKILEDKLNQNKLSGYALSTPVSETGVPGATTVLKQWKY